MLTPGCSWLTGKKASFLFCLNASTAIKTMRLIDKAIPTRKSAKIKCVPQYKTMLK